MILINWFKQTENNEDENKTNNYQTPPSDMLSLTGNNTKSAVDSNLNQSVEVKSNNTVITENNLSDAVIGLEPIEKQEDYQKKDMDSLLKETYSPKVEKEFKTRKENKRNFFLVWGKNFEKYREKYRFLLFFGQK